MDINPNDYRDITKNLPIGNVRKVPHMGCSTSDSLRIEHGVDGIKYYCFKCSEYHFEIIQNSPGERLRREQIYAATLKARSNMSYDLPEDFSNRIPAKGLAWLGRGGWNQEMIHHYNIGFSVALNRVILPVYNNGVYIGYTARAVESWQQPKYLEKCPQGVMWESHGGAVTPGTDNLSVICESSVPVLSTGVKVRSAVLTEDILSAGRCGKFIKAYALMGTSLDTKPMTELIKYDKVLAWLDPDRGGSAGLLRIVPKLRLYTEVYIIESGVDPKLLTDKEIKEKLWKI